jgi:hypothetical protein
MMEAEVLSVVMPLPIFINKFNIISKNRERALKRNTSITNINCSIGFSIQLICLMKVQLLEILVSSQIWAEILF